MTPQDSNCTSDVMVLHKAYHPSLHPQKQMHESSGETRGSWNFLWDLSSPPASVSPSEPHFLLGSSGQAWGHLRLLVYVAPSLWLWGFLVGERGPTAVPPGPHGAVFMVPSIQLSPGRCVTSLGPRGHETQLVNCLGAVFESCAPCFGSLRLGGTW